MLTFDEASHTYYWDGQAVPNVTRVISHLTDYSRIPPATLKRAQEEGKAVHKMVELDCKGDLDVESLPEWMRPRYEAWCKFRLDTGFDHFASECKLYHPALRYAGTADLFGEVTKMPKIKGVINIDVKRSLYAGPAIGLQTAGYAELWNKHEKKAQHVKHRAALVLKADGNYKLTVYDDPEDRMAFLACLQQHHWKERHYGST